MITTHGIATESSNEWQELTGSKPLVGSKLRAKLSEMEKQVTAAQCRIRQSEEALIIRETEKNEQAKMWLEKESLLEKQISELLFELETRPTHKDVQKVKMELHKLQEQVDSEPKANWRAGDIRALMGRDKDLHNLGLSSIKNVSHNDLITLVQEVCRQLRLNDPFSIPQAVDEIKTALKALPIKESFAEIVMEILFSDIDIVNKTEKKAIEILKKWKEDNNKVNICLKLVIQLSEVFNIHVSDGDANDLLVSWRLTELVETAKQISLSTDAPNNGLVERNKAICLHLMHLFKIPSVDGCITALNRIHSSQEELKNIFKSLCVTLQLPLKSATATQCINKVSKLMSAADQKHILSDSNRAPDSSHRAPDSSYRAPDSSYRAPDSSYRAPDSSYRAPDSSHHPPDSSYPAPNSSYRAPDTSYRAPDSPHHPPDSSHRAPDSLYRAPQNSYRAPDSLKSAPDSSYCAPDSSNRAPNRSRRSTDSSHRSTDSSYRVPTDRSYRASNESYHEQDSVCCEQDLCVRAEDPRRLFVGETAFDEICLNSWSSASSTVGSRRGGTRQGLSLREETKRFHQQEDVISESSISGYENFDSYHQKSNIDPPSGMPPGRPPLTGHWD
eukprot:GHVL01044292.1.p1 GENE.GHVL01044292.1~~GHVL01044292.1.p1  ORF type:complete len:615 (-),score=114.85 GHVL01044292.1:898-2742(-)